MVVKVHSQMKIKNKYFKSIIYCKKGRQCEEIDAIFETLVLNKKS